MKGLDFFKKSPRTTESTEAAEARARKILESAGEQTPDDTEQPIDPDVIKANEEEKKLDSGATMH